MNANLFRRFARRVMAALAEMDYAQRRMIVDQLAIDHYLVEPDKPPVTYQEFLARTSGPLLRERTARERGRGQRGCP